MSLLQETIIQVDMSPETFYTPPPSPLYSTPPPPKYNSEEVPSSLLSIVPIVRLANELDPEYPRIAWLCINLAMREAHAAQPNCTETGCRRYLDQLIGHVYAESTATAGLRQEETDLAEIQKFYASQLMNCLLLQNSENEEERLFLPTEYEKTCIIYQVMRQVTHCPSFSDSNDEVMEMHKKVVARNFFVPFNIIPPSPPTPPSQMMLQSEELQIVMEALRSTHGLPWATGSTRGCADDILDWLQATFKFQVDSVKNQREHVSLLLANVSARQDPKLVPKTKVDKALTEVMDKLFENYEKWCSHLGRNSSIRSHSPTVRKYAQQYKLLCIGLYLLIWGEAANIRFLPECLCYIFHQMAHEMYAILAGNVSPLNGEDVRPAYGNKEDAFLLQVVTPIYIVVSQHAIQKGGGKSDHSASRNYDDFNEYFWSPGCFKLGWPMRLHSDFFCVPANKNRSTPRKIWIKTNFAEIRSFWHIFRSFSRMWIFFSYMLTCNDPNWLGRAAESYFYLKERISGEVVEHLHNSTHFKPLTSLGLMRYLVAWAVIDILLSWKARQSMSFHVQLRYGLKFVSGIAWVIVLFVTYARISEGLFRFGLAVAIYMLPHVVAGFLFMLPLLGGYLEKSDNKIVFVLMWWSQCQLHVGRGIQGTFLSRLKYTMFWVLLLTVKMTFSYYFEVKPLMGPTKKIMETYISKYSWPEFSFLAEKNIGCVIVLWAPSLLVYFMDTQIWYCIFSTLIGGICGAFLHLVEIQTLGMLRSRFRSLPSALNKVLIPVENTGATTKELKTGFSGKVEENPSITKVEGANFAQLWNEVSSSFREEDLISNREMGLMIMPNRFHLNLNFIQWPPFLLAGKIPLAMDLVEVCSGQELKEKMEGDALLYFAVAECEASLRHIITSIVQGDSARQAFENVFDEVSQCAGVGNLINLERSDVHCVYNLVIKVVDILLRNKEEDLEQLKTVLQDILETVLEYFYQFNGFNNKSFQIDQTIRGINSISFDGRNVRLGTATPYLGGMLFASPGAIKFPVEQGAEVWKENLTRLHLLLTMKESAKDIPINVEARRRISFFTNSLFMDMPTAPKVENMRSFSVLTSYYSEDVLYTVRELELQNEDGVSILFYLQNIFPDEWTNFLERIGCNNVEIKKTNEHEEEVRCWASYRGQTLFRTVRGIMYYRKALEVQAFLNFLKYDDLLEGYKGANYHTRKRWQAVADTKFTYVLSCQQYGSHKRSGDARAQDILKLMSMYPSLRVAYIDEVEEPVENAAITNKKVYYSVLVKASVKKSSKSKDPQPVQNLDQVVYRIKLPGPAILGEGKPENQNHAIVFTRGEALQTIDMNQDNYLEEALKIRNLLEEFNESHNGRRTILGLREHIFTGSVSSLAWFMSNQEMTFVTIGQRVLANPLKVRFHYGHPDVFDRLFHLTRGGISKASKVINLSEDIFAGFNSTLRGGNVTHHEYIQVGKGREVGFNQISLFEAKIANGNGEQTISRDVYRLGHHFDFFRMLSLYFTTVGFYVSSLVTVLTIYLFLYGRLYLVFSGLENIFSTEPDFQANKPLQVLLTSEAFVQFGFFFVVPMLMEICLERGFRTALSSLLSMHVQLAPVFFTFSLGTKIHYYGRTLLHGGAEYRGTGRGFVVAHASFTENYMLYSRSHFIKGIEIMILLVVCQMFGNTYQNTLAHILFTMSMWFVVGAWLFAPFLFNPSGFDWHKMVDDWTIWKRWINNNGGSGVPPGKSWESWWENQHEYLRHSGIWGCFIETVLSFRFLIYQFGLIYHLKLTKDSQSLWVYLAFWIVVVAAIIVVITLKNTERINRIIKGSLFLIFNLLLVILMTISMITLQDIIACSLAFACTGWLGLLIAQVFKPFLQQLGWWPFIREVARFFEGLLGLIVFIPLGILAWFPFVSETHTRILFNQAFSRQLNISLLLGGKKDH